MRKQRKANGPGYTEWLHDLTVAGYASGVTVKTEHKWYIDKLYEKGEDASAAMTKYIEFGRRGAKA